MNPLKDASHGTENPRSYVESVVVLVVYPGQFRTYADHSDPEAVHKTIRMEKILKTYVTTRSLYGSTETGYQKF